MISEAMDVNRGVSQYEYKDFPSILRLYGFEHLRV